ncbi:MAG TPA: hypothetical protein PLH23_10350 [Hyphomonadaceae bacterium]|nr:hypothetical protein [Hyphomonadaceae bacterium]HPI48658.1 hypothetical protein [Hyphomonadaceae bacterium]
MGFFDPAYKKMLLKSPGYFRAGARDWEVAIEAAIARHDAKLATDLFCAAVIGILALETAKQDPASWSVDALGYIRVAKENAMTLLPMALKVEAVTIAAMLYRPPVNGL